MRFTWFKFQVQVVSLIHKLSQQSYKLKIDHKCNLHILFSIWFLRKII
jgi:hypothetical protein